MRSRASFRAIVYLHVPMCTPHTHTPLQCARAEIACAAAGGLHRLGAYAGGGGRGEGGACRPRGEAGARRRDAAGGAAAGRAAGGADGPRSQVHLAAWSQMREMWPGRRVCRGVAA